MQKFLITSALVLALGAPAFAADSMSGPQQPSSGGMAASSGMSGGMAHDGMAMDKKKKPKKHDTMSGGSSGAMSGPQQTGGGMSSGMDNH